MSASATTWPCGLVNVGIVPTRAEEMGIRVRRGAIRSDEVRGGVVLGGLSGRLRENSPRSVDDGLECAACWVLAAGC